MISDMSVRSSVGCAQGLTNLCLSEDPELRPAAKALQRALNRFARQEFGRGSPPQHEQNHPAHARFRSTRGQVHSSCASSQTPLLLPGTQQMPMWCEPRTAYGAAGCMHVPASHGAFVTCHVRLLTSGETQQHLHASTPEEDTLSLIHAAGGGAAAAAAAA